MESRSLILGRLDNVNIGLRIPILDATDHSLYLRRRSNIDHYLATQAQTLAGQKIDNLKLKDLLDNCEMKNILDHGFALVRLDADLTAKPMTQTGMEHELVLGCWVTNAKIEEVVKSVMPNDPINAHTNYSI